MAISIGSVGAAVAAARIGSSSIWPTSLEAWVSVAQDLSVVLAIVFGAVLGFLRFGWHRVTEPHVVLHHEISHRELLPGSIHLAVEVSIRNSSRVVVKVRDAQISVWDVAVSDQSELAERVHEIEEGETPDWPNLARKLLPYGEEALVIEPGETDVQTYEFIVPDFVNVIAVDSFYYNQRVIEHVDGEDPHGKARRKTWWGLREARGPRSWSRRTFCDLQGGEEKLDA